MMASALLAGSPGTAFADTDNILEVLQNSTVRGKVVDASGEPVIGASVVVKGTTVGVITDLDGNFILNNVSEKSVLVISYVGYKSQEIAVSGKSAINVTMQEDSEMLDEVVVVGYGAMKKSSLTGSVTVVDSKIFENKGSMSNPLQALQGQAPGVRITRSSSAPGEEGWGVSLRGAVSKNTTEPLLIIDGVPSDAVSDLQYLNPSDIETMNFLKDASAAIYGAKAAGGVIIVTTKRPQAGKLKIEYNGSYTRKMPGLQAELMSLDEWAGSFLQAMENDGLDDTYTWYRYVKLMQANKGGFINVHDGSNPNPIPGMGVNDYVFHDVNWTDVMWGPANSTQHDLSFSGGNEKVTYRLSAGYLFDDSNLRWGENNNQQYTFRSSNVIKATDRLTIESVISAVRKEQVTPTQIGRALNVTTPLPGRPVSTIDGKPYLWGTDYTANWLLELGGENKLVVTTFNLNETLKYQFTKELTASATFGYSTNSAIRDEKMKSIQWYHYDGTVNTSTANPYPTQAESKYTKRASRTDNYSVSGYLNYAKTIGKNHNINAMAGMQYDRRDYEITGTSATDIQSELGIINGNGVISIAEAKKNSYALLSYFGRLNYNYNQRYLIEFNARYDGSSKFQPENRWKGFYGVSAGWRVTEEAFMVNIKKYIEELKIRASYGEVGNQSGIGLYDGVQLYNFNTASGAYIGDGKVSYIAAAKELVTTNRTWERIKNYNVGFDFTVLNSRLSGSVDLYMKKNDNMLIGLLYPGTLGGNAPASNNGKFESKGYEGMLRWSDKIGEVSYHIGGTYTYMENKLLSGGNDVISAGFNSTINGYPLNSVFGYRYAGKIQNEEDLQAYKNLYYGNNTLSMPSNLRVGDHMYEDVNKDGKLTQDDLVFLGTDDPKVTFAFDLGLEWRGFDVSAIFQGAAQRTVCRDADSWKVPFKAVWMNTSNHTIGKVWSPENPNGRYPAYSTKSEINNWNYMPSSWFIEDGTYLRLKNLTVGYTIPKAILTKITKGVLENFRVYVTGTDIWENSKINDGWDPEATRKVSDRQRYPFTRTYTVGLNATF